MQTTTDHRTLTAEKARAGFDAYVRENGLGSSVRYLGGVRGAVKEAFLRDARLFLLPTVFPWDGEPISIAEGLAVGTPVLASNCRESPEQVIDAVNGRHVRRGDPTGIADAVRQMVDHPHDCASMSERAVTHFEASFTRAVHVQRMLATILGG